MTNVTWLDGLQFLGFTVFFGFALIVLAACISLSIYIVSLAINT